MNHFNESQYLNYTGEMFTKSINNRCLNNSYILYFTSCTITKKYIFPRNFFIYQSSKLPRMHVIRGETGALQKNASSEKSFQHISLNEEC